MRRALLYSFAAVMLALPAQAAVAIASCQSQPLSPDQRAAMSDIVFEGKAAYTSCKCMPLASGADDDKDGPEVQCTDMIDVVTPIKGAAEAQYRLDSVVMLDKDPNKTLSHGECKSRVSDRDDEMTGNIATYYLRRNAEGFLESVPATTCR